MNAKKREFTIEEQQPFYVAFYGHRVGPSHLTEKLKTDFKSLIDMLKADLQYYHKEVTGEKLREALIVALTVMHRLEAKHPNAYTKVPEIGMRAFKHADRFLCDDPLPLPPIVDEEEVWELKRNQRADEKEKTNAGVQQRRQDARPRSEEESQRVSEFLKKWRKKAWSE